MWRVILIFAAVLVVANTMGVLPEADDTECVDEGEGKQCPPTCPTCPCAWHSLTSAPVAALEVKAVELTTGAAELPAPRGADGLTAPPPTTRPPIV